MPRTVIAVYRPFEGREAALDAVVARHWPVLKAQGLVTDRRPFVMRAANGTIVEVFEWLSAEAIERAHHDPVVQQLWSEFGAAADYLPLSVLDEAKQVFAEFESVPPP